MPFEMKPLKLHIDENTFHSEVYGWPGVQMEVREGEYVYDFTGMMDVLLPGETPEKIAARVTGLQLNPVINRLNDKVHRLNRTIQNIANESPKFPTFE